MLAFPVQSAVSALTSISSFANNDSLGSVVKLKQNHGGKKCFKVIQQDVLTPNGNFTFILRHLFVFVCLLSFLSNRG